MQTMIDAAVKALVQMFSPPFRWVLLKSSGLALGPISIFVWVLSVAAGIGVIVGSVFLMPAVTALLGSFFVDDIALEVERTHYPTEPVGTPLPLPRAVLQGAKTALLAILIYLIAVPFLLVAGAGAVIFFLASAYLLGREYFELAAMRHQPIAQAKRLRQTHQSTVFLAGILIAAFVSIPIVNLATPLFATALMVHVHHRIRTKDR
jgi:CysZ protein